MSGQTNETQWYIARDGKQHGPLTDIEMRTFVAHNYLRASDLIWRPGLPEWQAAPAVFPAAFQAQPQPQPQVAAAAAAAARTATRQTAPDQTPEADETDFERGEEPRTKGGARRQLAIAATVIAVIGGGALALTAYREPLMELVSGKSSPATSASDTPVVEAPDAESGQSAAMSESADKPADTAAAPAPDTIPPAPAASEQQPTATATADATTTPTTPAPATGSTSTIPAPSALGGPQQTVASTAATSGPLPGSPGESGAAATSQGTAVAAIEPSAPTTSPAAPPSIDGSEMDTKLQKIQVWALIKKEYPDWYADHVSAANKLIADKKPDSEVALHLAQGLVALRRQHAEQALAASPERLERVAVAFLDHLKALRSQSVSACYGFISKGETSPAVVQMLERPETAVGLNAQADAIFEAAVEGANAPVKHEAAIKSDYDVLIKELGKLGWKDEDLQVFSNPKLLAKREPDQVCKMVQEWFTAHLAVPNKGIRQRLLYETLKPVVSG